MEHYEKNMKYVYVGLCFCSDISDEEAWGTWSKY